MLLRFIATWVVLSMSKLIPIDKTQLRRSFEKAADTYDAAAVLQKEVCQRLAEKLDYINFTPQRILDIGAGTGTASYALQKVFPSAEIVALDIAMPMLKIARQRNGLMSRLRKKMRFVNADTELLPFQDKSFDLVFSNLTLQWVNNLQQVLAEFRRVLRSNGMILFSTFGPDTLKELRASWQSVDQFSHVNDFLDMHDIGDAMMYARLAEPVMDTEYLTLTYQDVFALMKDLKDIGAHNVTDRRQRGLTGKNHFKQFQQAYEQFRVDGVLPATYEVVYGHAWVMHEAEQPGQPGMATVSLSEIKRT